MAVDQSFFLVCSALFGPKWCSKQANDFGKRALRLFGCAVCITSLVDFI